MKTYEKPKLTAISLSGNEQLCGSCSVPGKSPILGTAWEQDFITAADTNKDRLLGEDEKKACFGPDESCTVTITTACKFASAKDGFTLLAWS